jgi:F-type H+-transporting ATPase subunit b
MKRFPSLLVTALVAAAIPGLAMASGGGEGHGPVEADYPGLIRHGINLLILVGVLYWALKGPLTDFLAFRRSEVKDQLDASLAAKTQAEAKFSELSARLENFEAEIAELRARVRADAESERSMLLSNAQRAAESFEQTAKRTVTEEIRRARAELKAEAVELSVQIAEELLTKNINDEDQARLTSDYLAHVEETARS